MPSLRPFPQTRALVERLLGAGLRVGMATSAKAQEVDHLLRIASVDGRPVSTTAGFDAAVAVVSRFGSTLTGGGAAGASSWPWSMGRSP